MKPTKFNYPFFEANQVLTSDHLNGFFNYSNEQERLTRANLIGIGIVCGLEVTQDNATIQISKGCGITSKGYLLVEPENVIFSHRKNYTLPKNMGDLEPNDVPFRKNDSEQYDLWELVSNSEESSTPIDKSFLDDKVVVLFLEPKLEPLRNCIPNNCNDKGSELTVTVRRLLIKKASMDEINKGANNGQEKTSLAERLKLPDLCLPRYDVPNTYNDAHPITSSDVLLPFQRVFELDDKKNKNLVDRAIDGLNQAYKSFEPILTKAGITDPSNDFKSKFGFLSKLPAATTPDQVKFLQYYYDFFDDLIRAYDEFRWQGVELMCACCPPESLFPRHLMLSELPPASSSNMSVYRHHFIPSSALSDCEGRTKELIQLFQRLVEMIEQFSDTPFLIDADETETKDKQIHITPSKLGNMPLSDKAIPYYYTKDSIPRMYNYWSVEKTLRIRSKQNLSYHAQNYPDQKDDFVINPLRYDLENYNFLRIEGHLGKSYRNVTDTLISLKKKYRLPIEIVALSTGDIDEARQRELICQQDCHFQDLMTLCEVMCRELSCLDGRVIASLYGKNIERQVALPVRDGAEIKTARVVERLVPGLNLQANTLGALIETKYSGEGFDKLFDVAEPPIIDAATKTIGFLMEFADGLEKSFCHHGWDVFDKQYQNLKNLHNEIVTQSKESEGQGELSWFELTEQLGSLIYACKLQAIKAINEEYDRRVQKILRKHTLAGFLEDHPGIQHKAGVPLGGTFIVIYHADYEEKTKGSSKGESLNDLLLSLPNASEEQIAYIENIMASNKEVFTKSSLQNGLKVLSGNELKQDKISAIFNEIQVGNVIADFYLPYLCCSDCAPVQFVLPKIPPTFTVTMTCNDTEMELPKVIVTPRGGVPPYFYKIDDDKCFKELPDKFSLDVGEHSLVISDGMGAESVPQCIVVPSPLDVVNVVTTLDESKKTYHVNFKISEGMPPYKVTIESGKDKFEPSIKGDTYSYRSKDAKSSKIQVTDSYYCKKIKTVEPPNEKQDTNIKKNGQQPTK